MGRGAAPAGTGGRGEVRDGDSMGVVVGVWTTLRSGLDEKKAAVAAAPVAAEAAAMMAMVVFDILDCFENRLIQNKRERDL